MEPTTSNWRGIAFIVLALLAALYFSLSAIQGDFGLFQRVASEAELQQLTAERDRLAAEVTLLELNTRRLSDSFLDLDLLDQQVRKRLGFLRADEVVLR